MNIIFNERYFNNFKRSCVGIPSLSQARRQPFVGAPMFLQA